MRAITLDFKESHHERTLPYKRTNPRILDPLTVGDESEKQYRISVTCQENAEQEIRLLLINSSSCKTLYLNNLESGDVVGVKVEIVAEYYWDHF